MFTAQPHSWLARLHHHVARAQPLRRAGPADECRLLANGFVGFNLVAGGPAHNLLHSGARQQATQQVPYYEKGLPLLLDGWQALVRVAATRGLPDGWGVSRPVEDLFFYPLVQMSFARWYNVATRNYGLG